MNKTVAYSLVTLAGLALFAVGLILIKTTADSQRLLHVFPYICVGFGCGIMGHGLGEVTIQIAKKRNPAAAKQLEIEKKDERNQAIVNRAKAKAYDLMVFVYGAIFIALALMNIDLTVLVLLVFAYMLVIGYGTYYRYKYYKEM